MDPGRANFDPRPAAIHPNNMRGVDCTFGLYADGWFPRRLEIIGRLLSPPVRDCLHGGRAGGSRLLHAKLCFAPRFGIFHCAAPGRGRGSTLRRTSITSRCPRWRRRVARTNHRQRAGRQEVAVKIEQHPEVLCQVVGLLFPSQDSEELIVPGLAHQQASQLSTLNIFDLLRSSRVNEVIVALAHAPTPEIRTLLGRIRDMGVETSIVPQSYELYAARPNLVMLDGLPLVQLHEPGLRRSYVVLKRILDVAIAAVLLLPAFLFLASIAAILLTSKRDAFRWETRCGQYGTRFQMLRLNVDRPVRSDSKFERLLEYLSITELPQLWNVIRGQMSLVGPRPDPMTRSNLYSEWQQRRLRVKPGMTGLAQVHGLRDFSSPSRRRAWIFNML